MDQTHLIVGLGNPGSEHAETRHNAGFMLVERLAKRWKAGWALEKKFQARVARTPREGGRVWLCQPQTYMNSSGVAIGRLASFYRIDVRNILVVVDDADLPLGHIRLRPGGGTGGHHGLESIEQSLGSQEYARLRIGIGRQNGAREITGYVLGRFQSTETTLVDKVLDRGCDQVETWLQAGIEKAMSQFNGVVEIPANTGNKK